MTKDCNKRAELSGGVCAGRNVVVWSNSSINGGGFRKGIGCKEAGVVKLLSNNSHLLHLPAPKFLHTTPPRKTKFVSVIYLKAFIFLYI